MASTIANLAVSLTARTNQFNRGMRTSRRMVNRFGRDIQRMGRTAMRFGALVTASAIAAGYGISRMVDVVSTAGDRIAKTAKALGMSAEDVSALGFAAERSGADVEMMSKSVANFARMAGYAKDGLATYTREFAKLGITVTDEQGNLKGLKDLFLETSDALSRMSNETERLAVGKALFGRGGKELMPMLMEGRKGIEALIREVVRLGGIWTTEHANMAQSHRDAITNMKVAFGGYFRDVTMEYLPGITAGIVRMTDAIAKNRERIMDMLPGWDRIFDALEDVTVGVGKFMDSVEYGMAVFRALEATVIASVANMVWALDVAGKAFVRAMDILPTVEATWNPIVGAFADELDKLTIELTHKSLDAWKKFEKGVHSTRMRLAFEDLRGMAEEAMKPLTDTGSLVRGIGKIADRLTGASKAWSWLTAVTKPAGVKETRFAGAAIKGSAEAYSAIIRQNVARPRAEQDAATTAKNTGQIIITLDEINDKIVKGAAVVSVIQAVL